MLKSFKIPKEPFIRVHNKKIAIKSRCGIFRDDSNAKKLQVIFVATEVAPWSKVGGLGDVMEALPTALASRGHQVMTVAPRYEEYQDTYDTGIRVPVDLPKEKSAVKMLRRKEGVGKSERDLSNKSKNDYLYARIYMCVKKGVQRIFVDHSLFKKISQDIQKSKPSSFIYPYTHNADDVIMDLQYSVLCQVALAAPVLLWRKNNRNNEIVNLRNGSKAKSHIKMFNAKNLENYCNFQSVKKSTDINSLLDHLEKKSDNKMMCYQKMNGNDTSDENFLEGFIFIGNDWPCGLLPIWLNRYTDLSKNYKKNKSNKSCLTSECEESICICEIFNKASYENLNSNNCHQLPSGNLNFKTDPQKKFNNNDSKENNGSDSDLNEISKVENMSLVEFQLFISERLENSKTAFIIHNMAYEGKKLKKSLEKLNLLDPEIMKSFYKEKNDKKEKLLLPEIKQRSKNKLKPKESDINWLDAGLLLSDTVVTVSPTYADSIKSSVRDRRHFSFLSELDIKGIMNGVDVSVWNPQEDPYLEEDCRYDINSVENGKNNSKLKLQKILGLNLNSEAVVFGFVGRLEHQKGVDIILETLLKLFKPQASQPYHIYDYRNNKMNPCVELQFSFLGTGNITLEKSLKYLQYWFPGHVSGIAVHDEGLAHMIMAAADYLLVPSRFEPCGLVALCAVRYGTIPIVSPVGGLIDLLTRNNNIGFVLKKPVAKMSLEAASEDLMLKIKEAVEFRKRNEFVDMRRRCMEADVSWASPAETWEKLLIDLKSES